MMMFLFEISLYLKPTMKKWLQNKAQEKKLSYFSKYLKHELFTVFPAYYEEIGICGECDLHNQICNITIIIMPSDNVTL